MPATIISAQTIPLTVNGTVTGTVGIDPAVVLLPRTKVFLWSNGVGISPIECIVVSSLNGTVKLRKLPTSKTDSANLYNYGFSDVSAFLVADTSYLQVPSQVVEVDHLYRAMPPALP